MNYSAGEVAKKLGLSKDALRYYEKEGLLPPIERTSSGHRIYTDTDVEWIFLICCLRNTDMPIHKLKKYVSLLMESGGESIPDRQDILTEHKLFLKEKITTYQNLLQLIEKKLEFYNGILNSSDPDTIRCMDYAAEWEHFRNILVGVKHE